MSASCSEKHYLNYSSPAVAESSQELWLASGISASYSEHCKNDISSPSHTFGGC